MDPLLQRGCARDLNFWRIPSNFGADLMQGYSIPVCSCASLLSAPTALLPRRRSPTLMSSGGEYIPVIPHIKSAKLPLSVGSPAPLQTERLPPIPARLRTPSLRTGTRGAAPCASQVRPQLRVRKSQRGEKERSPVKNQPKQLKQRG